MRRDLAQCGAGVCQTCKDQSAEQKCVRHVDNILIENIGEYHGYDLSPAENDNILHPKVKYSNFGILQV